MSSRRIPDAASVTPFPSGPPGIVSGRSPTGASESPERPSRTRKGARVSRRVDRSSRPEEERFNIGAPRNTNGARHSTRRSRRDRPVLSDCNDGTSSAWSLLHEVTHRGRSCPQLSPSVVPGSNGVVPSAVDLSEHPHIGVYHPRFPSGHPHSLSSAAQHVIDSPPISRHIEVDTPRRQ